MMAVTVPRVLTTASILSDGITQKAVESPSAVAPSGAISDTLRKRSAQRPVPGSKIWLKRPAASNWVP